jgi:hypothetical protein
MADYFAFATALSWNGVRALHSVKQSSTEMVSTIPHLNQLCIQGRAFYLYVHGYPKSKLRNLHPQVPVDFKLKIISIDISHMRLSVSSTLSFHSFLWSP